MLETAPATLPPGPKGTPLVGHLFTFPADPLGFLAALARDHGDIAHFKMAGQSFYLLNHPDLVKETLVAQSHKLHKGRALERAKRLLGEGLLTSEGAMHRRQRMLIQPAFHRQRIEGYAKAMVDCAEAASARWRADSEVDMAGEMHRLTLAIVGRTLFDADVEGEAEAVGHALETTLTTFNSALLSMPSWFEDLPLPRNRRVAKARAALDETIYRMIAERRIAGEDRGDLLSMLLAARDAEGDGTGMTDKQVRDEAMTLFLAGHETTANALAWTWYLLSQHPAVEARLHAELDAVLGERAPTFADLPALAYTRQVLSEAMRVYPPVWVIGRRVMEAFDAGPYTIPPGALMFVSQWTMHHDPRYYPAPDRFDPERWTPEAAAERPRFAYFPFGGGPRLCIGEQFAWTEGVLLLASLARKWRPALVPGQAIALQPVITLRAKHGIRMKLVARGG